MDAADCPVSGETEIVAGALRIPCGVEAPAPFRNASSRWKLAAADNARSNSPAKKGLSSGSSLGIFPRKASFLACSVTISNWGTCVSSAPPSAAQVALIPPNTWPPERSEFCHSGTFSAELVIGMTKARGRTTSDSRAPSRIRPTMGVGTTNPPSVSP